MKYQVQILPRAVSELRSTVRWWSEHHSAEQARRWLIGIEAAIQGLSDQPEKHPAAIEADVFPFDVRELRFGVRARKTHRVLFAIHGDLVRVYSVRHLAQDSVTVDDLGLSG